jgi:2,3-bisphosphoglycerate-dependent phosphoglycerate mutase
MNMVTQLLIARHGNTFAPGDVVTRVGTTDLPLVDKGLLQGKMLGAYLKQNDLVPDVIFTSTLQRAKQTAAVAQLGMQTTLPIETLSIFNEIDYGPDENQPENKVIARVGLEAIQAWETKAQVPAGWKVNPEEIIQNWQDFANRILQEYAGKRCLVVTSNGIARFAPYLTGNFNVFRTHHDIKISTGAVCLFEHTDSAENWDCIEWNVKPQVTDE